MADVVFRSPLGAPVEADGLSIVDESAGAKSRVVGQGYGEVGMGEAQRRGAALVYCTSPDEWTVLGQLSREVEAIDLTHVRVVARITGDVAAALLAKVCALDFGDHMFPAGRAARTSVAAVATEIVREDMDGEPSYLLVWSRSYGEYLYEVLVEQAAEFLDSGD